MSKKKTIFNISQIGVCIGVKPSTATDKMAKAKGERFTPKQIKTLRQRVLEDFRLVSGEELIVLNDNVDFQEILKAKRGYYGNTEAAIEFAAEEYIKQYLNQTK